MAEPMAKNLTISAERATAEFGRAAGGLLVLTGAVLPVAVPGPVELFGLPGVLWPAAAVELPVKALVALFAALVIPFAAALTPLAASWTPAAAQVLTPQALASFKSLTVHEVE